MPSTRGVSEAAMRLAADWLSDLETDDGSGWTEGTSASLAALLERYAEEREKAVRAEIAEAFKMIAEPTREASEKESGE